jgi:hypothetical protein
MDNKEALAALMNIEGFRSLNQDIQTIINKSEKVKKAKKEDKELTKKEKKELSDEEKEYKSLRKQIQEKLIKFATRVPIFMYLTDYRERCLKDVITQLEPGLFKKVTGLDVKDFEMLCSIGVFNAGLMNDAIFKFKRYEDSSLSYTGINRHEGEDIGGWDTVIKREEYERLFYNQQATMEAPKEAPPTFTVIEPEPVAPAPVKKVVVTPPAPKPTPVPIEKNPNLVTATYGIKPTVTPVNPKPVEPQKDDLDLPAVAEGTIVIHKAFGEGTVIRMDKAMKHLRVRFAQGEKLFIFPDAFKRGFLTMK